MAPKSVSWVSTKSTHSSTSVDSAKSAKSKAPSVPSFREKWAKILKRKMSLTQALEEGRLKITIVQSPYERLGPLKGAERPLRPERPESLETPCTPSEFARFDPGGYRSEQTVFRDRDGRWKQIVDVGAGIRESELKPLNYDRYGPNDGGWL